MLTEMLGKGGTICSLALSGQIRCPLIVRPTLPVASRTTAPSRNDCAGMRVLKVIDAPWFRILNAMGAFSTPSAKLFRNRQFRCYYLGHAQRSSGSMARRRQMLASWSLLYDRILLHL
jgi:hypothetical protein